MADAAKKPEAKADPTGRTPTPEQRAKIDQEKREAFVKVATRRAQNAIKAIRLMHNLTGPAYLFTDAQAANLCGQLAEEVNSLHDKLTAPKGKAKEAITVNL